MKRGSSGAGIGGILKGLGDLVDKLAEIEKQGEELRRSGELRGSDGRLRGIYGVNVRVGLGGEGVQVEPFGNLKPDRTAGDAMVHEIREPVCDVFEEEDHLLIVAEMPGVSQADVKLEADGDLLTIEANRKDRKYRKELQLPRAIDPTRAAISANNGVVEIRCPV
ncbi:MAG: Hsp20/alpha crystallin family protein [Acidobacteria bacterium]|nr:Hsp20/alpha crystallin family protein [Acidobacteriota bacterium]